MKEVTREEFLKMPAGTVYSDTWIRKANIRTVLDIIEENNLKVDKKLIKSDIDNIINYSECITTIQALIEYLKKHYKEK